MLWRCRVQLVRTAALVIAIIVSMTPLHAAPVELISLPYACKIEHGRLRLEPSVDQAYALIGPREQRPFTICRDRQNCRTISVHRFTMACGSHRVPWSDIVGKLAETGHHKVTLADGQLGVVVPRGFGKTDPAPTPPPPKMLNGWCSDQFGGPTQSFLRQACLEARRFASNLGGPALEPSRQKASAAAPLFIAFPRGFAPVSDVGARLTLAPTSSVAATSAGPITNPSLATPLRDADASGVPETISTPKQSPPEPNERSAAPPPSAPAAASGTGSTWITSVHLARATVAASSAATTERQRTASDASALHIMLIVAGILAASLAAYVRYRRPVAANSTGDHQTLARLSAPDHGPATPQSPQRLDLPLAVRLRQLPRLVRESVMRSGLARRAKDAVTPRVPPLTPAEHAEWAALPPDARHVMAARVQLADRIGQLRSILAPLARTAPALQGALARDLQAADHRLEKVTVASLGSTPSTDSVGEPPDNAQLKRAHIRLQRVTADLDRLHDIIAGVIASQTLDGNHRQLPRDINDAYLALGVTAGVSLATLKKLVDALRVSWHPDLATSDDDRRHRNERITEINVAWDLIVGKRAAE